jgi:hypothetical protein
MDAVRAPPDPRDADVDTPHELPIVQSAAAEKPAPNAPALDVKALTDRALHFLATASNETLGACLVGLGAGTYLILGRVGLVLIGVVGGVVLHATWEGSLQNGEVGEHKSKSIEARRRELGVDVAHRLLGLRDAKTQVEGAREDDNSDLSLKLYSGKPLDFSEFKPETAEALTELTDAVIRDYVKYVLCVTSVDLSNRVQMVVRPSLAFRRIVSQLRSSNTHCFPPLHVLALSSQTSSR